jgi:DNA-binding SARP family transcriptional activator
MRLDRSVSAQTMLLLAMLVTRQDEFNYAELAASLWPELSDVDARAALRRHVDLLQQALPRRRGGWIACDLRHIRWAALDETWVDSVAFEQLSEQAEHLEAAAKLYTAEFAPYLDHAWVDSMRERLRHRICRVLEQLVEQKLAAGDSLDALRYAEEFLRRDPWREDALRRLLALRFHAGDRAGALAYYRRFCERLRAEFGVEPMPETVACYEAIVRGDIDACAAT